MSCLAYNGACSLSMRNFEQTYSVVVGSITDFIVFYIRKKVYERLPQKHHIARTHRRQFLGCIVNLGFKSRVSFFQHFEMLAEHLVVALCSDNLAQLRINH
jgi:hypothetical protein